MRAKRRREELGWNPTLSDFKQEARSVADAKNIESSWKKAI